MRTTSILFLMIACVARANPPDLTAWPAGVAVVQITSSGDQSKQPMLFFAPKTGEPRPMVILLHQWGGDYLYRGGIPVARWCIAKNWIFAQPDFRGPNTRPEAMGSDLVIADIASVVEYAKTHATVDRSRIFLMGASGGGHASLLAAGRLPGVFRAVSAWVPITDLVAWHAQTKNSSHRKYASNIESACGGPISPDSDAERQAIHRSPLTHLAKAAGTAFDLNAGIHDGHDKAAVPISHTLRAFNLLALPKDAIAPSEIEFLTNEASVPEKLRFIGSDASYGKKAVLFRRESNNVRVTLFEGGHELIPSAALTWLEQF